MEGRRKGQKAKNLTKVVPVGAVRRSRYRGPACPVGMEYRTGACPACPVEFPTGRDYSSGVAPADGTGVKFSPREIYANEKRSLFH